MADDDFGEPADGTLQQRDPNRIVKVPPPANAPAVPRVAQPMAADKLLGQGEPWLLERVSGVIKDIKKWANMKDAPGAGMQAAPQAPAPEQGSDRMPPPPPPNSRGR